MESPKVIASTSYTAYQVIIKVKDNSLGITDNIKAKLFQEFFTTKPTGEETGLGLSLSYDIITKGHGGTLTAESKVYTCANLSAIVNGRIERNNSITVCSGYKSES